MNEARQVAYPNIKQSWGIVGIGIVLMILSFHLEKLLIQLIDEEFDNRKNIEWKEPDVAVDENHGGHKEGTMITE